MRARGNSGVHGRAAHSVGRERVEGIERGMACPKVHYSMVIKNHETGARLKVELVDLPFQESRASGCESTAAGAQTAGGQQDDSAAPGARLTAQRLKKARDAACRLWGRFQLPDGSGERGGSLPAVCKKKD